MTKRSLGVPILLLLLAVPVALRAADPPVCDPPEQGPALKWCAPANNAIPITFNPSLDPALETQFGDANTRTAAFLQACADWNGALATVGTPIRLLPAMNPNQWAIDQGQVLCQEPLIANNIYSDPRGLHFGDGGNQASTGHNHNGNLDLNNLPLGPGWILPAAFVTPDTMGGFLVIDRALAITASKLDNANPNCIIESDISWYTHFGYRPPIGPTQCVRQSWDYRYPLGPDAARYDFYTVMLHELGHVLGLDHQNADAAGDNVMQSALPKGKRRKIGPKEITCLCERYSPQPANCANVTPVRGSSWGRIKSIYR